MANNDRIYEAYMGEMGEKFRKQTIERMDWILQQVGDRETVLDIGCSQGIASILCAQQGAKVTGIEIQKENCDFANELLHREYSAISDRVRFINQDFMNYNEKEKYDALILTEVLEHLENAEEFLRHAEQFLKEDGLLVITVPFSYCDHPDHVYTFYLGSLVELVGKVFTVNSVFYGGKWLGCVAGKTGQSIDLNKAAFAEEETAFLELHRELDARITELAASLENVNRRYKESCEAYDRVKDWYSSEQKKTSELTDNYNRLKGWHESSLEKVELLQQQADQFKTVIKEREQKLSDSRDAYERLKQWRENDQNKLIDAVKAEHQQMLVMQKAKRTIQKQQTEIQLLHAENESYKQKLSVIYNTWYGKLAMKCYNFLKKLKRRLTK